MTAEPPDPMVGGRIGPVRIEKKIGGSGRTAVYVGEHKLTSEEVAVKFLSEEASNDAREGKRFFREADLGRTIDHPGVVKVTETGTHEKRFFLLMEMVRGMRLDQVIQRDGRLTFEKASRIVKEIAQALDAIHAVGAVHRDIRPQSILLDHKDRIKICDLSHATFDRAEDRNEVQEKYTGDPTYASPEQIDGRQVDGRTDFFSLGVIYYHMLTAKHPYPVTEEGRAADPRPIETAYPNVDPRAARIVMKMIAPDPARRFASGKELCEVIDATLRGPKPIGTGVRSKETDPRLIPDAVRSRLGWSTWLLLVPSIVAFFLAGALTPAAFRMPGGLPLVIAASVLLLLDWAIIRRDLISSGRLVPVLFFHLAAAACAFVSTALVPHEAASRVFANLPATMQVVWQSAGEPASLMAFGAGLIGFGAAFSFDLEQDSKPPVLQALAILAGAVMWYFAATGGALLAPLKQIATSVAIGLPFLIATALSVAFGVLCTTGRICVPRTRWMGIGFMVVAGGLILLFGTAGASGVLASPSKWMKGVETFVSPLPRQALHSGALAVAAAGLLGIGVRFLRLGLKRFYEFHAGKN